MERILETELLAYCLSRTQSGSLTQMEVTKVLTSLPVNGRDAATEAIVEVLRDEAATGHVTLRSAPAEQPPSDEFSAIIRRGLKHGEVTEITLFVIQDAITGSILPVFGLILAVAAGGPLGLPMPFVTLAKALWSNLRRLRRPEDADAIDVLEATAASAVASGIGRRDGVTRGEIAARLENLPEGRVMRALERLYGQRILKVARWGGQAGNLADDSNLWKVRF
jgi:hypothetical protein